MKYLAAFTLATIASFTHATSYTKEGTVTAMFAGPDNTAGFFVSSPLYNPANCPKGTDGDGSVYLLNYGSEKDWSKVHSMLLSAYMAEKKIRIGVNANDCYAGFPIIDRVAFKKGF